MGRTYQTLSFGTARCIGIVRTMSILAHLTCLRICVIRCFGIVGQYLHHRHRDIQVIYLTLDYICLPSSETTLLYIVDWLLQRPKDYSDTTAFGWPTLWMSSRTFCSTLRFEAVRCYLYVENWFVFRQCFVFRRRLYRIFCMNHFVLEELRDLCRCLVEPNYAD